MDFDQFVAVAVIGCRHFVLDSGTVLPPLHQTSPQLLAGSGVDAVRVVRHLDQRLAERNLGGNPAGWIKAPAAPRWIWVVLFMGCISAAGFFTYLQLTPDTKGNSSSGSRGEMLSAESPVKVRWFGQGDTIEMSWDDMDYPDLHHYSVDVYGLSPNQVDYNVGYRIGDELRTSDTANPISEANEWLKQDGRAERVTSDETWRVCVIGMKDAPGGVDISPYIIKGSKRCSDPFTIPKG